MVPPVGPRGRLANEVRCCRGGGRTASVGLSLSRGRVAGWLLQLVGSRMRGPLSTGWRGRLVAGRPVSRCGRLAGGGSGCSVASDRTVHHVRVVGDHRRSLQGNGCGTTFHLQRTLHLRQQPRGSHLAGQGGGPVTEGVCDGLVGRPLDASGRKGTAEQTLRTAPRPGGGGVEAPGGTGRPVEGQRNERQVVAGTILARRRGTNTDSSGEGGGVSERRDAGRGRPRQGALGCKAVRPSGVCRGRAPWVGRRGPGSAGPEVRRWPGGEGVRAMECGGARAVRPSGVREGRARWVGHRGAGCRGARPGPGRGG